MKEKKHYITVETAIVTVNSRKYLSVETPGNLMEIYGYDIEKSALENHDIAARSFLRENYNSRDRQWFPGKITAMTTDYFQGP